jgi:hypothetical protein
MFERKVEKRVLKKLEELNVDYKLVPSEDYTDLVLYPDNYSVDNVWFSLYRFYDTDSSEVLAEDKDGNFYGKFTEDEFLNFVKTYKV